MAALQLPRQGFECMAWVIERRGAKGTTYMGCYRDSAGKQRSAGSFGTRRAAQRAGVREELKVENGQSRDTAGRISVRDAQPRSVGGHARGSGQGKLPDSMRAPYPGESRYRTLARSLRGQIREDRFAENEALPTEQALAEIHGLSRQTVRRAFLELVSEGLVFRVPGRGTFVTPKSSRYRRQFSSVDDLMNLTVDTELAVVDPLTGTYDDAVAKRLRITERSMYSVRFQRLHRGDVFCLTQVYLPRRIGTALEGMPALVERGHRGEFTIIGLLESRGVTITEAEQVTTAVAASVDHAALLACDVGTPLLHVERLYIDDAGVPIEYAISDFLPNRYSHRIHLGRAAGTRGDGDPVRG